jgi:hypothetical protein
MMIKTNLRSYFGSKKINAMLMTRGEYNAYRGWQAPKNENPNDNGYLVEYVSSEDKPNTPDFEGYVSWSPAHAFEAAYREIEAMPWGLALEGLKKGKKAASATWNGKGMCVYIVPENGNTNAHFELLHPDNSVSKWIPSINDNLSESWYFVD